jgi:hypothetical protein
MGLLTWVIIGIVILAVIGLGPRARQKTSFASIMLERP